ncbi:MAG TPA: alkaline phosphatase family protein [Jatrophihabitans sp.]
MHKAAPSVVRLGLIAAVLLAVALFCAALAMSPRTVASTTARTVAATDAAQKIKHVVIITQENRSFDSYFGTYPGADGIPMRKGVPTVCAVDKTTGRCVKPYVDNNDVNIGGPHSAGNSIGDIDGGRMDGFISEYQRRTGSTSISDVMGYHTRKSVANYWKYADNFVLNDHMFASSDSWSLPEHLFMVSEWSASCPKIGGAMSCTDSDLPSGIPPDIVNPGHNFVRDCSHLHVSKYCRLHLVKFHIEGTPLAHRIVLFLHQKCYLDNSYVDADDSYNSNVYYRCHAALGKATFPSAIKKALLRDVIKLLTPNYAWTDLTYLMYRQHVSWRYYVMNGTEPDCRHDDDVSCASVPQNAHTPGIWNPLPYFQTVRADDQTRNVQTLSHFYRDAQDGTLPAVSWVTPSSKVSEHPPSRVSVGEAWVTGLINTIMKGPDWRSTAIFVSWDEWGGFYDHVVPPKADADGYGLRVPGLVISPYAKRGYIDHQTLSHDAYIKFIEDVFLGGARIDPATDGRPDRRPTVRENNPQLGDLLGDFDFNQKPRRPMVLPGQIVFAKSG